MKKQLQTQFFKTIGFRLVCCGVLLSGFAPGTSYGAANDRTTLGTMKRVNVTGTVTDTKGEPLPGVSIKIKGTNSGTSTDVNGVFRLNLPTGNEVLVVTYLGFKSQEVVANGRTKIDIKMLEDSKALDEVVVVGYGVQKKAHLTGSVVDIKAAEVADLPVTNIGVALSGRLQGVGVSGGNSRPGSKASLTIRNPIVGAQQSPLYVIDGVIQMDGQNQPDASLFNNLDPAEIESISVLKDASAAVYGVRGAAGVVLVTTKKGKAGKPRISYNGSVAISDEAYRTKMMSAYEFAQYFNVMNGPNGSNKTAAVSGDTYRNFVFSQDELDAFKSLNYDWLDGAWSSSYNTRHNLSVSGGAEKATYFGSIGYTKQNGNLGTLDYDRWNFRAGTDVEVASNLKVSLQVSGNNDNQVKTFNKVSGEGVEDDYKNLLLTPRYIPTYINGLPVKLPGTNNDLSRYHFYELQRLGNLAETDGKFFTVNLSAEYKVPFVKGLNAKASYSRNNGGSRGSQVGTKYDVYQFTGLGEHRHIYDGATEYTTVSVSNGNRLYFSNLNTSNTQMNFILNYDRQFGKHNISGLFTVERGDADSKQEDVWRNDPIQATNGQFNTAFGTYEGRTLRSESGSLGYIARVNYRYAEKYLFEFLFRTDASTKFAPENYWGKFYSGSLGWVISEEDFFKIDAINFLKLRYATGLLGSDTFQAWAWKQRYTLEEGKGAVFGGNNNSTNSIKMGVTPNRGASWTQEFKNNIGIDARFLNERLSTTIEGYYNYGSDLLIQRVGSVPVTVGGSVASENYGKANSFGYEIEIGWNSKVGKDFNYGISARFNWADNKVVKGDYNSVDILYPWKERPGKSSDVGQWGYDYLGMFRSQEEIQAYYDTYHPTSIFGQTIRTVADLKQGMLYYRDVRGPLQADGTFAAPDGIIDENDQVQLKKRANNHYGFGTTLKAGYKGFSFDCVIAGSFGGWSERSERKKLNNDISRVFTSLPEIWGDVYDPELNPSGSMPNPEWDKMYDKSSKFWEVNAFRMRIASINMGYSLPKKITDKMKISNARLYLSGVNPFNLYNPFGYKDPSIAWDAYPALKTYSFGLNLTL
ncbi:SusC/RagA family TonB-linked outer membrane protein [Pararcticibacter amylolyticus]|uniref:SusC/RagA family TonB-linked outer membrane protein n=1 Tax=Pararcticibacter amylolyticus TaxID=2173175 RepID=A0A2U2PF05_9SPHI|nr:TonB-dependent receptor [Pararcticibacter amylolyticus]PWG79709.1 SusC/RagA family TonB-linked outer membrane protein [Pararcticibacter amylolyticus]